MERNSRRIRGRRLEGQSHPKKYGSKIHRMRGKEERRAGIKRDPRELISNLTEFVCTVNRESMALTNVDVEISSIVYNPLDARVCWRSRLQQG